MINIQEHIDALDKMVVGPASQPDIRSQIAFIAREVAALQADYERLAMANAEAQPESPALSEHAKKLLLEIELSDVSAPKGLSILRVTETEGDYLPHLYNAKPPSHVRFIDLNEVIQAADDLIEAGWLKPHAVEGKVTEYRRTSRIIQF